MKLARLSSAFLLWAAIAHRGLFAQQLPGSADSMQLRGVELRYVLPEPLFGDAQLAAPVKALYVNAWAFGSSKLAQLVSLADSTEIDVEILELRKARLALLQHVAGSGRIQHATDAKAPGTERLEPGAACAGLSHDFFSDADCLSDPAGADGFCTVPLATCCSRRTITGSRPFCWISEPKSVRNDFTYDTPSICTS